MFRWEADLIPTAYLQEEITELKKKVEEFEQAYSKVELESNARFKEAEEAQMKAAQLQESIERYLVVLLLKHVAISELLTLL